jgi:hypothetical protein
MTKSKKTTAKKTTSKKTISKSAQVVAKMQTASGCTREQALKILGWKAVSMAQVAGPSRTLKIDRSNPASFVYRVKKGADHAAAM